MGASRPCILIIEDEPGIADTLQYALRTEGYEPVWAATGKGGLAEAEARAPALVVLDVGLPDGSGFDVFRRLRAASDVPVIFLTARSDEIDRVVGLELGADDYVAKPFSPRELVARVRSILRRAARTPSPTATTTSAATEGPIHVDDGRRQIRYYGHVLELSRYEYGLLKTLASWPGHVYTRDVLLDQVWTEGTGSLDRTVDAHVKTLRAKMKQVAPDLEPIRTHRGAGYALAEDLPPTLP